MSAEPLPTENIKPIAIRAPRRAKPPAAPQRDLQRELVAASALKDQLKAIFGEDEDVTLLCDTIEGETDLLEMVDQVLVQILLDREQIAGIDAMSAKRELRKKRLDDRCRSMETMLLGVLDVLEQRRIERPLALIFSRAKPDKIDVTDEAAIPSQFFKTPEPALNRADLLKALKDRRDTLAGKLDELDAAVKAGSLPEDDYADAKARLLAAFPPIPGAELIDGGTGVTVKWS
ncbi:MULTISPECIES: siphovirus Gp157 family protein [unclassified Bradyrhizobium]|uniref:siphovirus Gp157 family protein n=1 Tax=unclassified Bradyrhizobium TaxID=2631580 RepID=UPI001BAACB17|nr:MULTISPECIES: siphovirus Gp157 family protein [unclassified Bradyrhizobium]MBR1206584.1 siphovirus Gp157 family protein [Bradyrhizobium sp. AUGA SZCCT0124]MBR1315438.1 siphovirus Gp157 family protein [Bradyrhizobium sp. AUGA SZCCT0051]MBR1338500.1 siphovirus Gp157 family protein [Bradyrhizobium sp. AUGA SZCCT0105]MBR1356155.1 siphovirus Gp157 family protein [Bradyrhizobium sp. AUGA SZCCT0045]